VGARPLMSRPARASRITAAWIGNGSVMPQWFGDAAASQQGNDVVGHTEIGKGRGH